jgi:RNA polymerase sigma factor (sigma-70 family)
MKRAESRVFIVEDDPSMRNALKNLLRSVGLESQLYTSAQEFLDAEKPDVPSCLILDVRLPGMSGLDLQKELAGAETQMPVIFITAHGDIPMSVRAMKAGAVEFLPKPFRDQDLLDAIQVSLTQDRSRRQRDGEIAVLQKRLHALTPREREVFPLVVSGRSNKEIAGEIGISEITVKVHRGNLMRKMQATSFAELLRMSAALKIPYSKPRK